MEEGLIRFYTDWDAAIVSNNTESINRYMSEDWVCVGTQGGITPKASFLEWIGSGDLMHTVMDTDEIRVKIYGNTGVITGRGTSAGTYKGTPFSLYEWSTSVFVYENEKWACVLTMLTPANK